MEKKSVNRGLMFLLIFLVVVGVFLLYSRLTFTGYVTNVIGPTSTLSESFTTGVFDGTQLSEGGVIVLNRSILGNETNLTSYSGNYTSGIFDGKQNAIRWHSFVYKENISENSTINFYFKTCDDSNCEGEEFEALTGNLSAIGRFFQYRVEMQGLVTGESPKIYDVNVSYSPFSLPIIIESPQATTYTNASVLVNISSNVSSIWFYNGTANETYIGAFYRTFANGAHVLTVWARDSEGNENSTSVSFTVSVPQPVSCGDGSCNGNETCSSCATDCGQCQQQNETPETETTTQEEGCGWICGNWSECVDGVQTRICNPANPECVPPEEERPSESQPCEGGVTTSAIEETETTEPTKKGFFSFVGSAIVGPIFKSKIGLTFVILLVLVIGGLLVYKFLLKDKLKLKFFGKKKFLFFH